MWGLWALSLPHEWIGHSTHPYKQPSQKAQLETGAPAAPYSWLYLQIINAEHGGIAVNQTPTGFPSKRFVGIKRCSQGKLMHALIRGGPPSPVSSEKS